MFVTRLTISLCYDSPIVSILWLNYQFLQSLFYSFLFTFLCTVLGWYFLCELYSEHGSSQGFIYSSCSLVSTFSREEFYSPVFSSLSQSSFMLILPNQSCVFFCVHFGPQYFLIYLLSYPRYKFLILQQSCIFEVFYLNRFTYFPFLQLRRFIFFPNLSTYFSYIPFSLLCNVNIRKYDFPLCSQPLLWLLWVWGSVGISLIYSFIGRG